MGRRRAYDTSAVIQAAREQFWRCGYELTSVGDLEACTGLDRSSLYHAFGSKQGLFEAALRSYLKEAIESRLAAMRQPDAGIAAIVALSASSPRSTCAGSPGMRRMRVKTMTETISRVGRVRRTRLAM